MTLPNLLTIARIAAIPVIVFLAVTDSNFARWFALLLFIVASLTDYLDGYLARTMNLVSPLGRMLDPIADKLLVGALLIALAWDRTFTQLDLIPAIAIMLREIFVSGLREYLGNENVVVPVSNLAKYKTTLQLISLAVCLAEPVFPGLMTISNVLLWAAALITLWTGWSYWQGAAQHMSKTPE